MDGRCGDVVWGVLGCPRVLGFFCAVTSAEYVGNQDKVFQEGEEGCALL